MTAPAEQLPTFRGLFARWFRGDAAASELCLGLVECVHLWDDVIDRDAEIPPEAAHRAFRFLLVGVHGNPFWQRHAPVLLPLVESMIFQWHAANAFEAAGEELPKAYMLRAGLYHLFPVCASLIGGHDWGRAVAEEVWRSYAETLETFTEENRKCRT